MADIEAGRYDCVLVIGVEQERNVPGTQAPKYLGAAAWIGHEGQDAKFMWPYMFSELADEYDRRYGLDNRHLHAIAELNMRNAKANPLAQTRGWTSARAASPPTTPTTRSSRVGCGAPTVARSPTAPPACSRSPTASRKKPHAASPAGATAPPGFPAGRSDHSQGQPYVFPHVRQVIKTPSAVGI